MTPTLMTGPARIIKRDGHNLRESLFADAGDVERETTNSAVAIAGPVIDPAVSFSDGGGGR